MRRVLAVFVTIILMSGIGFWSWMKHEANMQKTKIQITMGIQGGWGPLNPPQQSTYAAEIILGHVFETLVDYDLEGNLRPKLAKSWKISADLKTFEFTIDTDIRFSNGVFLTAQIIKTSFERALAASPVSANESARDVLYELEGFDDFSKTKKLSGIRVASSSQLVLKFRNPLRTALAHLAGVRYAAFVESETGDYYGTGPYQFLTVEKSKVILEPNPHSKELPIFSYATIIGIDQPQYLWGEEICKMNFDVLVSLHPDKMGSDCFNKPPFQMLSESGAFNMHLSLDVNGLKGRLFSDGKLRRALQYLIYKLSRPVLEKHFDLQRVVIDKQFIPQIQMGRLSDQEAADLIEEGLQWVPDLIKESQQHPIDFKFRDLKSLELAKLLNEAGVRVVSNQVTDGARIIESYYKTHDFDLMSGGKGVAGLDPDGLYHYLGEFGAIGSPAIGRKSVWSALQEGRSEQDSDVLTKIYQKLSRAILTDVPAIHLAHNRVYFLYNTSNVKLKSKSINHYRFSLAQFSLPR